METNAVLSAFILAMVIHQDVFKKAQEELDCVVGQDRLPDIRDRESLPYLRCLTLELYRYVVIMRENIEEFTYVGGF